MRNANSNSGTTFDPQKVWYTRATINLDTGVIDVKEVPCRNLEDVLGGFGRSFQMLMTRDITEALSADNPLIINTGLLTGSNVMTGLRTYFSAYSPLKYSDKGLPAAIWSAASGKFGSKMKWTGLDEIVVEGRSSHPQLIVIQESPDGPQVTLKSAEALLGMETHDKIMALQKDYADAHFAVIGPAGEAYENCYFAAVALSTENELKSGDDKCRFAGRGGMGTVMGSKNLIGLVAQSKDKLTKLAPEIKEVNKKISTGPGSVKFREAGKGGLGGTWSNFPILDKFHTLPQNNFRPKADGAVDQLFRENLEQDFVIKAESCYRCGINCHKNIYERTDDGKRGAFRAKFDYEPLNLLATNLGIHDGEQAWRLVQLVDNLGMDSISCGTTVGYVLGYNERHPDVQLCNGARFGDFDKIFELIDGAGRGLMPDVGRGVKRLSVKTGDLGYAMHVKGLELPAYLPETNPGYPWAIAGGHMTMGTFMSLVMEGDTSMDYWVKAITQKGLLQVRDDLLGTCKFAGMGQKMAIAAVQVEGGIDIPLEDLLAAVRRAYLRGLAIERKQGYQHTEYTLPAEVFDNPNPNVKTPAFLTREFFAELQQKVWEVFEPEMATL